LNGGKTLTTVCRPSRGSTCASLGASPTRGIACFQSAGPVTFQKTTRPGQVLALHNKGDFFGEGCLSGQSLRLATVATMSECAIMRIDKVAMVRALHDEPQFTERFMAFLLARNARVEEDLVDQLFNSSEKRLARALC
jgi:CRP-like cAMP-binding protein